MLEAPHLFGEPGRNFRIQFRQMMQLRSRPISPFISEEVTADLPFIMVDMSRPRTLFKLQSTLGEGSTQMSQLKTSSYTSLLIQRMPMKKSFVSRKRDTHQSRFSGLKIQNYGLWQARRITFKANLISWMRKRGYSLLEASSWILRWSADFGLNTGMWFQVRLYAR